MHQMASNIYILLQEQMAHKQKTRRNRRTEHKDWGIEFWSCLWPVPLPRHAKCWNNSLHTSKTPRLSMPCYTIRMYHICEPQAKWLKWIASTTCNIYRWFTFVMLFDYFFGHESVLKLIKLYPFNCWKVEFRDVNGYEVKASAPSENANPSEVHQGTTKIGRKRKQDNNIQAWKTSWLKNQKITFMSITKSKYKAKSKQRFCCSVFSLLFAPEDCGMFCPQVHTNTVQLGCSDEIQRSTHKPR